MDEQIISPVKRRRVRKISEVEINNVKIQEAKGSFLGRLKPAKNRIINRLDEFLLYAVIFCTPLFFLPFTNYPISLNKQAFIFFIIVLSFFVFLFGVVNAGKFKIKINLSSVFFALLAIISLTSWFFNGKSHMGFFGVFGGEPSVPINILIFFMVFLLIRALLSSDEKKQKVSLVLLSLSSVFSALTWLFVQNGIIGSLAAGSSLTNTIGLASSLVLFLSVGFFISIGFYFESDGIAKKLLFAAFIVLFAFVFFTLGFKLLWYIIALGFAFFIAIYFSGKQNYESKKTHLFIIIILLIAALIFAFSSPASSGDTRIAYDSALNIIKSQYQEGTWQTLLGSGPGSFKYSFLKYRDVMIPDISLNRLQFSSGYSTITDYFSELGMIGGVSALLFFASVVFYGIRLLLWQIEKNIYSPLAITLFIATLSSFAVNIFGISNFTNMFYSFVLSALVVGAYQSTSGKEPKVINFSKNPSQTFLMLIFLIMLMGAVVFLSFKFGSRYIAEFYFQNVQAKISSGDSDGAFASLEKAIKFDKKNDTYFKAAADINFSLMKAKLGGLNIKDKKAVEDISLRIKNVESLYNRAVLLNLEEPSYWSSLGMLYETAALLDNSLLDLSMQAYEKAAVKDPKSADILFSLGKVYYDSGKYEEAEKKFSKIIFVFPRDPNARFYLALTFMMEGRKEEALREFEIVKILDPSAPADQFINKIKEESNFKAK